jgi:transcriptional regulator with PAS, ATPase and Fis domain
LSLSEIQGRSDSELFGTMDQMEDEKTGEAVIRGVTGRVRRTRIVDGTPQMFHDTLWPIPLSCPDQARWIIGVSSPVDTREAVVEGHRSPVMVRVMDKALAVAKSDSTVLLTGESGSGKGHLAEEIHHQSRRAGGPFFVIDCAGIKNELFEAELFGHERGAYTGAVQKKRGLLALAQGGTVFLDEIGEVPLHLQPKLLRFLEKKSFTKLGGRLPESADVRIIAATNRNLEKEVQEGLFREDLYYRLNVVNIEVPALREHLEDLRSIVDDILPRLCGVLKISPVPRIDPSEIETMKLYHWPGNIRELRNILERALLFSHGGKLTLREAMPDYIPEADEFGNKKPTGGSTGHQWLLSGDFRKDESQGSLLDHTERALIEQALEKASGVKAQAARLLGITWAALKPRLKRLGISRSK